MSEENLEERIKELERIVNTEYPKDKFFNELEKRVAALESSRKEHLRTLHKTIEKYILKNHEQIESLESQTQQIKKDYNKLFGIGLEDSTEFSKRIGALEAKFNLHEIQLKQDNEANYRRVKEIKSLEDNLNKHCEDKYPSFDYVNRATVSNLIYINVLREIVAEHLRRDIDPPANVEEYVEICRKQIKQLQEGSGGKSVASDGAVHTTERGSERDVPTDPKPEPLLSRDAIEMKEKIHVENFNYIKISQELLDEIRIIVNNHIEDNEDAECLHYDIATAFNNIVDKYNLKNSHVVDRIWLKNYIELKREGEK